MSGVHCQLFPDCMRLHPGNEMPSCERQDCPGATEKKRARDFVADLPMKSGIIAFGDRHISSAQAAYGLLWRSVNDDKLVHAARRELYAVLTLEERRAAIAWVLATQGAMTTNEIIAADIRVGQFPQSSVSN